MPRPGTPVIHPRMLEQGLRPVALAAQTGQCQLLRYDGTSGVLDPTTLVYSSDEPTVLWTGPCRFQPKARALANTLEAGEEQITVSENQVTIPLTAPEPHVADLLRVVTSSDPNAAGKVYRVTSVNYGDLQAERHITVEDNETRRPAP